MLIKIIKSFIREKILKTQISETFTAFTYVHKDKTIAKPGQITTYIRWLKDVTTEGITREEREEKAFKAFREQNNLKRGQVWIF